MAVLAGFPMVDQRTAVTTDNLPSENADDDCVAAAVLAATMYLLGVKTVGGIYTPDNFKDKGDGQGYVGFTAASQYINFCASLGVKLYAVDGDSPSLVQQAHQFLAQGKPVIFTQDDWIVDTSLPKYQGWTHVACWYRDDTPGTLTSMDPWGGFARMKSDAVWIPLLRDNQIWIAERIEETVKIDITTPGVSYYFDEMDAIHWKCKQTGHIIHDEGLKFYKGYGNAALCGLSFLGLPKTDEIKIEELSAVYSHFAGHGIMVQFFERGVTCYDPAHLVDNPPGTGSVYLLQLYSSNSPGQDPHMLAQIADLQSKLAALGQPANPQLLPDMQQIRTISGKY